MGYKDLQVLLLLLEICALGNHGAAQEVAGPATAPSPPPDGFNASSPSPPPVDSSSPPPPPVNASPPPSPPPPPSQSPSNSSLTFFYWKITSDINSNTEAVNATILTSPTGKFSFSLMVVNHSSCAAVVRHNLSNVAIWATNFNDRIQNARVAECSLNFTQDGLELTDHVSLKPIWSLKITAQLLKLDDNGCLSLWDTKQNSSTWQSFDYPTDILVPMQKLKPNHNLSAAQFNGEYSNGDLFFMRVDSNQSFLYENFTDINGVSRITPYFEVSPNKETYDIDHVELQQDGLYFFFSNGSKLPVPNSIPYLNSDWYYVQLASNGGLMIFSYLGDKQIYNGTINSGNCSLPGQCGSYGICSGVDSCTCPPGFKDFNATLSGCERMVDLPGCGGKDDIFVSVTGNTHIGFLNNTPPYYFSADSCKQACLGDCTCQMALYVKENNTENNSYEVGNCYLNLGNSMQTIRHETSELHLQTLYLRIVNGSDQPAIIPVPSTEPSQKTVALAFASGAGALVVLLIVLSAVCLYYNRRRLFENAEKGKYDPIAAESLLTKILPPEYTYQEVVESTGNFAQKLGSGGFSCVYLGHLPDNTKIAVKKLDNNEHTEKEFLEAVTTVGSILHANLVPLKGFCKEGQHRILVYELVDDGRSLNWFLFPVKNSGALINAQTRRSIALGTARGLAHLHKDCNSSSILHGGVKPENIMINRKMHPRLVDFGLVDLMSRDQRLNEAQMRGSCGYMAPEWIRSQPITEKVDVYSLGIVILELVSGRRCFNQGASLEKCFLPSWGFSLLRHSEDDSNRVLELVDPLLDVRKLPATDQMVLKGMIYVALWCVQEDASKRPPMKEVVRMLEGDSSVDTPPDSPTLDAFAREMCEGYASERAPESSKNSFMHSNSLKRTSDMRPR